MRACWVKLRFGGGNHRNVKGHTSKVTAEVILLTSQGHTENAGPQLRNEKATSPLLQTESLTRLSFLTDMGWNWVGGC